MKRGQETLMPNWALEAMDRLTLAADIRILNFLTRHRSYRGNTFTTRQIAIALELDVRTVQASTARLIAQGLTLCADGVHCSADAASRVRLPAKSAQAPRKPAASPVQKDSRQNAGNAVQNEESSTLNLGTDELMKASYASSAITRSGQAGEQAQPQPRNSQGPDGPAAPAAPQVGSPSRVGLTGPANQGAAPVTRGVERGASPAPIRAASGGDDDAALRAFHDLAGYGFTATYRLHLARWYDAYSLNFLRLAWRLAPTLPTVKVAAVGFVWLLNREKEWPEALRAQYERDLEAAQTPAPSTDRAAAPRVQVGDLLRWPDGHTATVERLDRAQVVTDSEDDRRGYVPFAVIGKSVEVLRS